MPSVSISYATATTPKRLALSPGVSNKIRVLGWDLAAAGTVTLTFQDKDANAAGGAISMAVGQPNIAPRNIDGWFDLEADSGIYIVLSGSTQVSGFLDYMIIPGASGPGSVIWSNQTQLWFNQTIDSQYLPLVS